MAAATGSGLGSSLYSLEGPSHSIQDGDIGMPDDTNFVQPNLDSIPTPSTRESRPICSITCRVPIPVIDLLPMAPPTPLDEGGIEHVEVDGSDDSNILEILEPQQSLTRVHLQLPKTITTKTNQFGVYWKYVDRPTYEPDGLLILEELGVGNDTATNNENPSDSEDCKMGSQPTHYPFPNTSQSLLSSWYFGSRSGERSAADFNELCKLISDARFQPQEVQDFTAAKRDACIDRYSELEDGGTIGGGGGGWQ
ncbi:hypothetical protein M422DRAFT_53330 [Sphaerobolus stellatus SS14]|uniref:Unplaced genomic scaffold SPHSTscaffold_165, whole genome shotgun sequence n=1 Tax=Sphaerobolus stellatus (strain SS14) TaxID=990650 RepID=A0A0C9TNJ5_SPHS4|nr:hypothetical protein M422DRAFT_53330 [Sphaerobolus stellatus SS14]